jgi:glycosyltransferase involved in cell wall biosynthesis
MTAKPVLSIITITKTPNLSWLQQTMHSIATQSFQDYEHIILDASDDDLFSEIKSLVKQSINVKKIRLIKQKTKGIWNAFEEAYSYSRGVYLGVINSDDYYFDSNVFFQVSQKLASEQADFIYGNSVRVDSLGRNLYTHKPLPFLSKANYDFFVFNISHHTLFFNKDILKSIPFITPETNAVDLDFMRRLYQSNFKGCYLNEIIASFRVHDNNFSSTYSKVDTMKLFSKWNSLPKSTFYLAKAVIFICNLSYFSFYITRAMKKIFRS